MKLRYVAVLFAFCVSLVSGSALAEVQKFNYPKNGSYRLDWCYNTGTDCGERAARQYCKKKGFDDQIGFKIDADIGGDTPTRVLKSGYVCSDDYCDGFKYITCEREDVDEEPDPEPVYIKKLFEKPKVGGQRIHYCFKPGLGCGKKAANAFCDLVGFDEAIAFGQSPILIAGKAPKFLGTGQICLGFDCVGFSSITCRKQE